MMQSSYVVILHRHPVAGKKIRIYGLPPIERLRRQFAENGIRNIVVLNSSEKLAEPSALLSQDSFQNWRKESVPLLTHEAVIYLVDANAVIDDRLIRFAANEPVNTRIASREHPDLLFVKTEAQRLKAILGSLPENAGENEWRKLWLTDTADVRIRYADEFDSYIDDLRLDFVPYFFPIEEQTDIRQAENKMYEANFKGTLDFIAIYIYKYPVREIVRWLSQYPWITPNQITFLSIASSFAVPFLFALGQWNWAILIGWLMFIFDSVDGKLARLTIRLSRTAGIIEHATSSPALFLWFVSLGWYFSGGDILNPALGSNIACWTLMILYWVDKSLNGYFRARFQYDLYNHAVFDQKFHLFACRRAIIHLIITIGYLSGYLQEGFYFLAAWMGVSFLVHLIRLIWIVNFDLPAGKPQTRKSI